MRVPFGTDVIELPGVDGRWLRPGQTLSKNPLRHTVDKLRALLPRARKPLVVVPDRTRNAMVSAILPGLALPNAPVVFASGTHRPMSAQEMRDTVGAHRGPCIAHSAQDSTFAPLGTMRVNALVSAADLVVVLSEMRLHYLAGFGGGRKMILPGLADEPSAQRIHAHSFANGRTLGCAPGVYDENPMHKAILQNLHDLPPAYGICIAEDGAASSSGELLAHHRDLATRFLPCKTVKVRRPLEAAIVCSGGTPYDSNLVQAHKSLAHASAVLDEDAQVVWVAACENGLGHADFLELLRLGENALREKLARSFSIKVQTAWSLRSLLARFKVAMITNLDSETVRSIGARKVEANEVVTWLPPHPATLPGASLRYVISSELS